MDQQTIIAWLAGSSVVLGGSLCSCHVWFALRIVAQLDRLETLVIGEIHKLDLRLTKLEAWRDGKAIGRTGD